MAALLAAAIPVWATPAHKAAKPATAPTPKVVNAPARTCAEILKTSGDSLETLRCLIDSDPQVRSFIGVRLGDFILEKDSKKRSYVTPGMSNDGPLSLGARASAVEWAKNQGTSADKLAKTYLFVGETRELPAWAKRAPLTTTLKPGSTWHSRLEDALANEMEAPFPHVQWTGKNQIAQGDQPAITAFLEAVAKWSDFILGDPRTKKDIEQSVAKSIAVDDSTSGGGAVSEKSSGLKAPPTVGAGFAFDDLYVNGAVKKRIYNSKDDGYREISLKIYSSRDANGDWQNQIGIVDITDSSKPSLPKFFGLGATKDGKFQLASGGREYVINVSADGKISLKRDGDGGLSIDTSVSELNAARNAQIRSAGTVTVDGKSFYALGQGGVNGSVMLFAKDAVVGDGRSYPSLMADVTRVSLAGDTLPIEGKPGPDLGKLGDKPFHLELDAATGLYKVAAGEGTKPKKDDAKDGKGGGADANKAEDGKLKVAVSALEHDGWERDEKAMLGPSDFVIMKKKNVEGGTQNIVHPSLPGDHAVSFNNDPPQPVFAWSKYVILENDGNASYYDIDALLSKSNKKALASYNKETDNLVDVPNHEIASHIITRYLQADSTVKDQMTTQMLTGLSQLVHGEQISLFTLHDDGKPVLKVNFKGTKKTCELYPNIGKCSDSGDTGEAPKENFSSSDKPAAAKSVCDKYAAGYNAKEKTTEKVYAGSAAMKLPTKGTERDDACLYQVTKNGADVQGFQLKVFFNRNGQDGKLPASIFGGGQPVPASFFYGSLGDKVVTPLTGQNPAIHKVTNSDGSKGIYGVYMQPPSASEGAEKSKADNCQGVVVYWGVANAAEALQVCQDAKFPDPAVWYNPFSRHSPF
jgi:hypothetical protein